MRVISGSARGHKLFSVDDEGTRPTADRMKESFFNMMAADLQDAFFLDLFSGTGAIGIEALSRGVAKAYFVEHNSQCVKIIRRNLEKTKLIDKAKILNIDCLQAIKDLGKEASSGKLPAFDIVFLDPPYGKGLVEASLKAIVATGLLSADGYIVAEQASSEPIVQVAGLEPVKTKLYSTTAVIFYAVSR